ncbi:MAG: hypothetical protein OES20_16030 [Gammaproteobacteria bacterium]|nr:hypothetical protein [Gammaproteobacteria bacterium]
MAKAPEFVVLIDERTLVRLTRLSTIVLLVLCSACASPGDRGLTLYHGRYTDNGLVDEILILQSVHYEDSWITVAAYSEVISKPSPDRRWETEGQVVKHSGQQDHWEYNALFLHRWTHYPWSNHTRITSAIGGGLSWATEVPKLELASHTNEGATQLLSYLLLELTVGIPGFEGLDLVGRIHHRSGVFGLFDGVHGGSNVISLGLRYEF